MANLMLDHGQHLTYQVTGDGPPVVLLHSALGDSRQWDAQVQCLASRYRCIRYDLLGYGKSSDGWEGFDPADNLVRLMDALRIDQATLVGSSMGGAIALHAAVRYPDRAASLVLAGTGLFGFEPNVDQPDPPVYHAFEAAVALHDVDRTIELAEEIWLRGVEGREEEVPDAARRLFRLMNRERLYDHPWEGPEYLEDLDDTSRVSSVGVPSLIMVGEHDTPYCHLLADYLKERMPHAELVRLDGCAHLPNLSQPARFTETVERWLDSLPESLGSA